LSPPTQSGALRSLATRAGVWHITHLPKQSGRATYYSGMGWSKRGPMRTALETRHLATCVGRTVALTPYFVQKVAIYLDCYVRRWRRNRCRDVLRKSCFAMVFTACCSSLVNRADLHRGKILPGYSWCSRSAKRSTASDVTARRPGRRKLRHRRLGGIGSPAVSSRPRCTHEPGGLELGGGLRQLELDA